MTFKEMLKDEFKDKGAVLIIMEALALVVGFGTVGVLLVVLDSLQMGLL